MTDYLDCKVFYFVVNKYKDNKIVDKIYLSFNHEKYCYADARMECERIAIEKFGELQIYISYYRDIKVNWKIESINRLQYNLGKELWHE